MYIYIYIYICTFFVQHYGTLGTTPQKNSAEESAMPSVCYGESSCTCQSIASLLCRGQDFRRESGCKRSQQRSLRL